jgi:hypothetical protein
MRKEVNPISAIDELAWATVIQAVIIPMIEFTLQRKLVVWRS